MKERQFVDGIKHNFFKKVFFNRATYEIIWKIC